MLNIEYITPGFGVSQEDGLQNIQEITGVPYRVTIGNTVDTRTTILRDGDVEIFRLPNIPINHVFRTGNSGDTRPSASYAVTHAIERYRKPGLPAIYITLYENINAQQSVIGFPISRLREFFRFNQKTNVQILYDKKIVHLDEGLDRANDIYNLGLDRRNAVPFNESIDNVFTRIRDSGVFVISTKDIFGNEQVVTAWKSNAGITTRDVSAMFSQIADFLVQQQLALEEGNNSGGTDTELPDQFTTTSTASGGIGLLIFGLLIYFGTRNNSQTRRSRTRT